MRCQKRRKPGSTKSQLRYKGLRAFLEIIEEGVCMKSPWFLKDRRFHKWLGLGLALWMYLLGSQSGSRLLLGGGLFYAALFLLTAVESSYKAKPAGKTGLWFHLGALGVTGYIGARLIVEGLRFVIQPVRPNVSPIPLAMLVILTVGYTAVSAWLLRGTGSKRLREFKTKETDQETQILHQMTLLLILATVLAVKAGMSSWLEAAAAVLVGFMLIIRTGMSLVRRIRHSQRLHN